MHPKSGREAELDRVSRVVTKLETTGFVLSALQDAYDTATFGQAVVAFATDVRALLSRPDGAEPVAASYLAELERDALAEIAGQEHDADQSDEDERTDLWEPPEIAVQAPALLALIAAWRGAHPLPDEGWQPIETAPKDGTAILAWHRIWEYPMPVCWERPLLDDGSHSGCANAWVYVDWLQHNGDEDGVDVTHWRPLQSPPGTAILSNEEPRALWKTVPVEPTEAMIMAAGIATRDVGSDDQGRRTTHYLAVELLVSAYQAMLAASPLPDPPKPEGEA